MLNSVDAATCPQGAAVDPTRVQPPCPLGRRVVMDTLAFGAIVLVVVILSGVILSLADWSRERRNRTIERRLALLLHHFGIDPTANVPPSEQVRRLAADPGKKMQAIRLYSKETGADIKTAAATINALSSNGA